MTSSKVLFAVFALPAVFCGTALLAGCGGSSAPAPVPVTGPAYVLTDISNGKSDGATAINNSGQALVATAGVYYPLPLINATANITRAVRRRTLTRDRVPSYSYLYDGARFQSLGGGTPYALNDQGQIAFDGGVGPAVSSDFNYFVPIPPIGAMIPSNTVTVQPFALNNTRQVVGTSPTPDGSAYHAFLLASFTVTDLGTLGEPPPLNVPLDTSVNVNLPANHSNSTALGINDAGQVVGVSGTNARNAYSGVIQHAFVYQDGKMTDLGTLGGANSVATSINNKGQAAGYAEADATGRVRATLWQNGQAQDLGAPQGFNSYALDINDAGQVVGTSILFPNGETTAQIAFVYRDGKMLDLNRQVTNIGGWRLGAATGINNKGQICGYGTYKGQARAFLLTPK